jgi:hypothetical protein
MGGRIPSVPTPLPPEPPEQVPSGPELLMKPGEIPKQVVKVDSKINPGQRFLIDIKKEEEIGPEPIDISLNLELSRKSFDKYSIAGPGYSTKEKTYFLLILLLIIIIVIIAYYVGRWRGAKEIKYQLQSEFIT